MDRAKIDWAWMHEEPIERASFMLNDSVSIIAGAHAGSGGAVISLVALEPEPLYVVELGTGETAEIPQSVLRSAEVQEPTSALSELMHWYAKQTDSDWEHSFGVRIHTLDNPGWAIDIDLEDTELSGRAFEELKDLDRERDWFICRVREGRFEGRGGPFMLERIIRTFLNWAHSVSGIAV